MKIQLNETYQRIPNDTIYNILLTMILALSIIWLIYSITSYSHYNVYLIEPEK
jgi:hypothetical protein